MKKIILLLSLVLPLALFSQVDTFTVTSCEAKNFDTLVIVAVYTSPLNPSKSFPMYYYVVSEEMLPIGAKLGLKRRWNPGEQMFFMYKGKRYNYANYRR